MDDDFDDDRPADSGRTCEILRNVAAYREVCETVRKSGTSSLIFGAIMLGLGYLIFDPQKPFEPFTLIYLSLGALELSVGLLNKLWPSAEGVLLDGLVLIAFGGSHLVRQTLVWQGVMRGFVSPISIAFGAYWLYQGYQHVMGYAALRRAFAERPTAAHLRWFNELLRDIRRTDPESDPQALDLPGKPRVRGKLLGDVGIFLLDTSTDVLIVEREHVMIEPVPTGESDRLPRAYLLLYGQPVSEFPLHPENWTNYTAWKKEAKPGRG
ncbi:MAG: hypothetical protein ACRC7O_18200 [Fimbriiglobus sp.]